MQPRSGFLNFYLLSFNFYFMIIETKNLTKVYKGTKVPALDKLDLSVIEGEIFGFIGPNGAGKSTTIRLLLDFIRPTSGSATIFGLDVNTDTVNVKNEIGYLPGEIFLDEKMNGEDCIDYYSGFKKNIDKEYLKKLVGQFDLDLRKRVGEYSKGNKQKLAIILSMMSKPKLLILDEPTSGLDPLNQQEFYKMMAETKKWGTTTFFSTHILEEAEKNCDRVGIIKSGKLVAIEDIDDFRVKNIRDIILEMDEAIPLSELKKIDGIRKIERTTEGYHLTIAGPNGKILKALSKYSIIDIKIAEPSLEEIFLRFYK